MLDSIWATTWPRVTVSPRSTRVADNTPLTALPSCTETCGLMMQVPAMASVCARAGMAMVSRTSIGITDRRI